MITIYLVQIINYVYKVSMKKFLFILLILMASLNVYSADQEILPLDDNVYEYIDYIYILDSKIPPTSAKPYSIGQMKVYLNSIDYNSLNDTAKNYYFYVNNIVNKETLDIKIDDFSSIDLGLDTGFEMYAHTNKDEINTHRDWILKQEDRIPLLKLSLKIASSDNFFTTSELQYQQGKYEPSDDDEYYSEDQDFYDEYAPFGIGSIATSTDNITYNIRTEQYKKYFSTNIPQASKYIDFDTPKRAIFSFGGVNWNFNYSKDKLSWGNSTLGNFIFNDHITNNFINLKFYSQKFNLNNTIAFLNTKTSSGESSDDKIKMFMTHRIEYRPSDFLKIAVSENVMYVNDKNIFLYSNPSYIYHNLNMRGMFNAIAHLETEVLLFNGINWYSQFVLDQATAPNEDESQSAAWGFSTGLNYIQPINDDLLSLSIEGLMTLPCLYRRDIVDFITFDRTFVIDQSYVIEPTFIGYPEGGDSLAFKLQGKYDSLDKFEAMLYYSLLLKGEVNIFSPITIKDGIESNDSKPNYGSKIFKKGVFYVKQVVHGTFKYNIYSNNNIKIENRSTLSFVNYKDLKTNTGSYSDLQFSTGFSVSF